MHYTTISLNMSHMQKELLRTFVLSILDYCNSLLQAVLSIFFLTSRRYRTMPQDSFSEHQDRDPHHPYSSFSSLATYWAEDWIQVVFALRSFLIRPPSIFQNFFTFTFLPGSSALQQKPKCSEYHPSEQSPVVSTHLLPASLKVCTFREYVRACAG